MLGKAIPDDLRRFLLISRFTVPHVEAVLLLREEKGTAWDATRLAARLYLPEKRAEEILRELAELRIAVKANDSGTYRYAPAYAELEATLDALAEHYRKHLVEITRLIHASADTVAEKFAAAFRFRQES